MKNFCSQYNYVEIWRKRISKRKVLCPKNPVKIWDVNVENIIISKLIKTKSNSKYLIEIKLDRAKRPLFLTMAKMTGR